MIVLFFEVIFGIWLNMEPLLWAGGYLMSVFKLLLAIVSMYLSMLLRTTGGITNGILPALYPP